LKAQKLAKQGFCMLLVAALMGTLPGPAASAALPRLGVRAALLLDNRTGQVLYSLNPTEPAYIASLTKIVTAILFVESGRMGESFVTSREASTTPPVSLHLETGERVSGSDLFYALLLMSANDVAVVIAEGLSGSVEAFARKMTERAHQLGARRTRFANPHGLHDPRQVSTAEDVAVLTRHALGLPQFRAAVGAQEHRLHRRGQTITNTNQLLSHYPGANGVKTGFTTASGSTMVATAARDGVELLAVVLGATPGAASGTAARLLDHGFAQYRRYPLARAGEVAGSAAVAGGRHAVTLITAADLTLSIRDPSQLRVRLQLLPLSAPLAAGDPVGELQFLYGEVLVGSVELWAGEDVPASPWRRWGKWLLVASALVWVLYRQSRPRPRRRPAPPGSRKPRLPWSRRLPVASPPPVKPRRRWSFPVRLGRPPRFRSSWSWWKRPRRRVPPGRSQLPRPR
jgi:D-alanyl-D-alanine carboxypeptidase (penicillin-binding protein 5/6)